MTRGDWLALGAIVALALTLRLVYLSEIQDHPLFRTLMGDPAVYFAQARDIAQGKMVPDHAYFHSSPFYPFFLALVARLGGSSFHAIRVVQSCAGTLSVALVFLLGRLTAGTRAGLVAAFLAAVYVPLIFFEGEVLEITLVITFLMGSLVLLQLADPTLSKWKVVASGALLGLAGLGKPNLLLFAPVGALWLAFHGRARSKSGLVRLLPAVLFFAAAGAVILPATIHNYRAEGDFIPVSSNGGINFFIGNHAGSPGVFQVPPEMRFDLRVASKEAAERETGRALSAGEVSDFWTDRTLTHILGSPGRWLRLMGRKSVLFWNHYEIPNHYHLYYVREFAPVLQIPIGTFGVVAPLGLFGIGLALKRRKQVGLLVLFGLTFMASVVPFFITGRYRLAVVPVLLVGAGYAVESLWRAVLVKDLRTLAVAAVTVGVLAVSVGVDTIEFGVAAMHNAVGMYLGRQGDMAGAAEEFEKAVKENPDDLSARHNLGLALLELKRFDEAAGHFGHAVKRHPRYYEAWIGLGRAHAGTGRDSEALEAWGKVVAMEPRAPDAMLAEALRLVATLSTGDENQ
ncbi:MAG: tetratricopeptide repeat protein [Candidatus Eisenbacteria bacterium]